MIVSHGKTTGSRPRAYETSSSPFQTNPSPSPRSEGPAAAAETYPSAAASFPPVSRATWALLHRIQECGEISWPALTDADRDRARVLRQWKFIRWAGGCLYVTGTGRWMLAEGRKG